MTSAIEIHTHLLELQAERYVGAAVTEIAAGL
jgi:hypothetical protein